MKRCEQRTFFEECDANATVHVHARCGHGHHRDVVLCENHRLMKGAYGECVSCAQNPDPHYCRYRTITNRALK